MLSQRKFESLTSALRIFDFRVADLWKSLKSHSKEVSQQRTLTKALFSHRQLPVFEGSLARQLRFHIFKFQFLREVPRESFVFHRCGCHFLKAFSHEMRFWEIVDARNNVSCSTKRASEDGWGRSAARRFQNGLGYVRIMVGYVFTSSSFSFWGKSCAKASFHGLIFKFLREVSNKSLVFTSWSYRVAAMSFRN